jgi:glycosyltransferase involved in cell wall biosynthesis
MVQPRMDRRGGAENLISWLSQGLMARGHSIRLITTRYEKSLWGSAFDGAEVLEIGGRLDSFMGRRLRTWALARRVEAALADCDLGVAHNFPATVWATRARSGGCRRVWFCHEPMQRLHWRQTLPHLVGAAGRDASEGWQRGVFRDFVQKLESDRAAANAADIVWDRAAAAAFDLILTNSAYTAQAVRSVYGCDATACLLGVPRPPVVEPSSGSGRYVVWVSSELPYKNSVGFIEAVRLAAGEFGASDLIVRAVGLGAEPALSWRREAGLEERLIFEGRVPYEKLHGLIAGADFLAYPTVDEPFGLVPLEAMAHGRAVLASKIGGPPETVVDGVTGMLADPLNPRDFGRALAELWGDRGRCQAMGAAGLRRFEAEFTLDAFIDRFLSFVGGGC